jgi:hypothetical protein
MNLININGLCMNCKYNWKSENSRKCKPCLDKKINMFKPSLKTKVKRLIFEWLFID